MKGFLSWHLALSLAILGLLGLPASAVELEVVPEPPAGVYSEPLQVSLPPREGLQLSYRFLEGSDADFLPWTYPVSLSALPGETRIYTLRVQSVSPGGESLTRDFRYTIARPSYPQASVIPAPGLSTRPVTVEADLPEGVSVAMDGKPVSFPLKLEGLAGELVTYRLELTPASPRDPSLAPWVYVVDRRGQLAVSLEVLSPSAGTWGNRQALVLSFQGLDQVWWAWGNKPDPDNAVVYIAPVLLNKGGDLSLTVWGKAKGSGQEITKTVSWQNGTATLADAGFPEAGVTNQSLALGVHEGWELSLDGSRTWLPMTQSRSEALRTSSLKVLDLRLRTGKGPQWRGVYWMDGRAAAAATVDYWGGWNPRVSFVGPSDAWYRAKWIAQDGTVSASDSIWGPSGSWKIPDNVVSAVVTTTLSNGTSQSSSTLSFPESGWIRPVWEPWGNQGVLTSKTELPLGGRVLPRAGFQAVYEIGSGRDVAEPGRKSPVLTGPFLPQVPLGADRTFYVRFAWRDNSGTVGPPTSAIPLRVDHLPPRAPVVSLSGDQILVGSPGTEPVTYFWAVTPQTIGTDDPLKLVPLENPLELSVLQGAGKGQWLHVQARDAAGNASALVTNWPLAELPALSWQGLSIVDAQFPDGEVALPSEAVLPVSRVALRPRLDAAVAVYVLESVGSELPENWSASMAPVQATTIFGISPGERKTFTTWWNVRTKDGWLWSLPEKVVFTLDQGAPQLPLVRLSSEAKEVRTAWTLSATPGQNGDKLTYTITRDGSDPEDPSGWRGLPWPGQIELDAAEGQAIVYRVRLAATSVSGLNREWKPSPSVTVDRTTPVAILPPLEDFTYRLAGIVVPLPHPATTLRYTRTLDGSMPSEPDYASPAVTDSQLEFAGTPGTQTLYRFRVRPYSRSGTPGPASDVYSVLIDRTETIAAPLDPAVAASTFTLAGLPEDGLSAIPVKLRMSAPWGTLRYELVEGDPHPRSVESTSPEFPSTLDLEGAERADRTYVLAIRSYSAEGHPVTPEARWTIRIDRSTPLAPTLDLEADTYRPEAVVHAAAPKTLADETLLYRWRWASYPEGQGQSDWQGVTPAELRFVAPGGLLTKLTVEAVVRDQAGNLSPVVERTLVLDRNVVYVDASAKTPGDGSRAHPMASVAEATGKMRREGRRILFLASGAYTADQAQDWTGFAVWGGLRAGDWESGVPGRSSLAPGKNFSGKSLLVAYDGSLELHRFDLVNPGVPLAALVVATNLRAVLDQSSWQSNASVLGWKQTGGSLQVSTLTALWDTSTAGPLDLADVDFRISDARFTVQNAQNLKLISLVRSTGLLTGLSVVTRRGQGQEVVLWAQDSQIVGSNWRILAGDGSQSCSGIVLTRSSATVSNLELDLFASGSNTGLQFSSSQADLQNVTLEIFKGSTFNQGVRIQDSQMRLWDATIRLDEGAYQGGFTQTAGTLELGSTGVFLAGGGQQAFGLQTLGTVITRLTSVNWVLATKTAGKALLPGSDWAEGSWNRDGSATGW